MFLGAVSRSGERRVLDYNLCQARLLNKDGEADTFTMVSARLFFASSLALVFLAAGAQAATPDTSTRLCRDELGIIGPCIPCPPTPPTRATPYCDIDQQPRIEKYPVGGGCKFNTIPDAGADERYEAGCEPYSFGVVPYEVRPLPLRLISQTSTTLTLGWDPPSGADGYLFSRSDQTKRPHTMNGARTSVVFGKGASWYRVQVIRLGETGEYRP